MLDVKRWCARPPSVEEVRPPRCPVCEAASRPVGGPIVLHGHGHRLRGLRGPPDPAQETPPCDLEVLARRYRCRRCAAVIVVVPREVLPRRHYGASSVGLALALFALLGQSTAAVRARLSTWRIVGDAAVAGGWITLRRWIDAVRRGELFGSLLRPPDAWSRRQVAESTALRLMDLAPFEGAVEFRAFAGAALAR